MNSLDPKALKRLADACRKAGIKHYRCADFEFTLTDEAPLSNYKKQKNNGYKEFVQGQIEQENSLSEEDLLLWSVAGIPGVNK